MLTVLILAGLTIADGQSSVVVTTVNTDQLRVGVSADEVWDIFAHEKRSHVGIPGFPTYFIYCSDTKVAICIDVETKRVLWFAFGPPSVMFRKGGLPF